MNSFPFARLSIVRQSKLVAAIYPACMWACKQALALMGSANSRPCTFSRSMPRCLLRAW